MSHRRPRVDYGIYTSAAKRDAQVAILKNARKTAKEISGVLVACLEGGTEGVVRGVGVHPNHQEVTFLTINKKTGLGAWTRPSGAQFTFHIRNFDGNTVATITLKN